MGLSVTADTPQHGGQDMVTTRPAITPPYCAYCAMHNHHRCADCACGDRGHNPGVDLAAAMRRYEAPDQAALPTEKLASDWHRKDERLEAAA